MGGGGGVFVFKFWPGVFGGLRGLRGLCFQDTRRNRHAQLVFVNELAVIVDLFPFYSSMGD